MAIWVWRRKHPIAFAGICGILVAIIGWAGGGRSFVSAYTITSQAVSGNITLPWHAPMTRYLATVVSYYSGIPGEIFAPSLAVGGALVSAVSGFWRKLATPRLGDYMAGFLAAITQSPFTPAIIVMVMSDGHGMVIALIAVSFLAKIVSSRLSPQLSRTWHLAGSVVIKPETSTCFG